MDLILDAGARSRSSKTGLLSHPLYCIPSGQNIFMLLNEREKKKHFLFLLL